MSDIELAEKANYLIENSVFISQTGLARKLGISREKLSRINSIGLIKNYPKAMTKKQASSLGKAMGNRWGKNFYLPRTPRGGKKIESKDRPRAD